jgi:hypothetical protein
MANTKLKPAELRKKMQERHVTVRALAVAAQDHPSNLSATLAGAPTGPVRTARILAAARRLGLLDNDGEAPHGA